uniref:WD repeat-containing protein 75-like n=1 Tax=Saccoglossus kowalevskii TaxID=10224 RepID=A0ABM0H045_SACKO|nr:PREDICTED: WD repeat-containing protein 75-like [Saccoglossus kowalevskii]
MRFGIDTCAGSSLIKERTIFSHDNKYLICCFGHVIKVLAIATGECLHELRGHQEYVTSVVLNPSNKLQLFSSSLDGTVKLWDYTDGILFKTYHIGVPIHALYVPVTSKSLYVTVKEDKRSTEKPYKFSLKQFVLPKSANKNIKLGESSTIFSGMYIRNQKKVSFGVNAEFVAAVSGKELFVKMLKNDSTEMRCFRITKKSFTSVVCHPTDYCIATGDGTGQLLLWRNFTEPEKKVSQHKNHWHSRSLQDICFSAEGSYIYTVGLECTVVQWQYETNHKSFLPRLGSPICYVSCSEDNSYIATSHLDNAIQVLSNGKIIQTFQGLTREYLPQHGNDVIPTGVVLDPRSHCVVLNGKPGHLQFYDMHTDKLLYNLDIVRQNYITADALHNTLVQTDVEKAAFDCHGNWLATVERRDDGVTAMEMRLKFWQWSDKKQSFVLNTSIESPHQDKVTAMCFRPANNKINPSGTPMAVTSSKDNKFKIWILIDDTDIYRKNVCWTCQSVGFYHDLPTGSIAFSTDGSLLAVVCSNIITLWDPDTNGLKTRLCQPVMTKRRYACHQVLFGNGSSSHCLVAVYDDNITVWNLLTCSVSWSLYLDVSCLVKDPSTDYFAAFTNQSDVYIFKASEQNAKHIYNQVSKSAVVAAIFVPHKQTQDATDALPWQQKSQLYFINEDQQLKSLRSIQELDKRQKMHAPRKSAIQENLPSTPFSKFLETYQTGGKRNPSDISLHGNPGSVAAREIMNTPAHVLPPVSSLCNSFMKILLIPNSATSRIDDTESDEESSTNNQTSDSEESEMEEDGLRTNTDQSKVIALNGSTEHFTQIDAKQLEKQSSKSFSWMKRFFKTLHSEKE